MKKLVISLLAASSIGLISLVLACTDHGLVVEGGSVNPPPPDATVLFERDVHPILLASCAFNSCHGEVNPQHDMKVLSYSDLMKVSPLHGRVIIPGDADISALYLAISPRYREIGLEFRMPQFSDTLTTAQQDTIHTWIEEGALDN